MSETPVVETSEASEGKLKRERKPPVDLYKIEAAHKKRPMESGTGVQLSTYHYFCKGLEAFKADDEAIRHLHSLFYGSVGKKTEVKKKLKQFSGFPADREVDTEISKIEGKKSWTVAVLKDALGLFGLEKSGTREDLIGRLVNYVANPQILIEDSEPTKRSKKASSSSEGKSKKSKTTKDGKPKKKRAPSAYILFTQAHRSRVKEENPEAGFGELTTLLSHEWNDLSAAEKEVWNKKSQAKKKELEAQAAAEEDAGGEAEEEQEEEEEEEAEAKEGGEDEEAEEN